MKEIELKNILREREFVSLSEAKILQRMDDNEGKKYFRCPSKTYVIFSELFHIGFNLKYFNIYDNIIKSERALKSNTNMCIFLGSEQDLKDYVETVNKNV